MATASPDNIKQWKFPDGNFIQNLAGHTAIINTLSLNQDNVLVSGGKHFAVTDLDNLDSIIACAHFNFSSRVLS